MAWRLDKSVVRGEMDNRERGLVRGTIWLLGRAEAVRLTLAGNCWRDMAGCVTVFENPNPRPGDGTDLHARQDGVVGDMTASRKVRVLDCPIEEALQLWKEHKKPAEHMGNSIYLEWFSEFNGRVVVESADYRITVSHRAWTMTEAEQIEQQKENQQAAGDWMQRLGEVIAASENAKDKTDGDEARYEPMDEFEWEKFLKESDARNEKYGRLLEKYKDHPDCDKLVAREMGWDTLEDALEARDRGELPPAGNELDDLPPLAPNPLTEGVDWVRDEDGHIRHPLQKQSYETAMDLWLHCQHLGLLGETGDEDLQEMLSQAQITSAKLAGALNHLAYNSRPESGFIVARLKRALMYLNQSLSAAEKVASKKRLDAVRLEAFRKDLFEIREQILALMERFRNQE